MKASKSARTVPVSLPAFLHCIPLVSSWGGVHTFVSGLYCKNSCGSSLLWSCVFFGDF